MIRVCRSVFVSMFNFLVKVMQIKRTDLFGLQCIKRRKARFVVGIQLELYFEISWNIYLT